MKPKVERFCQHYVVHLEAAKAAEKAGYSERSAKVTGCRLLKSPEVQARIAELQAAAAERAKVTTDQVFAEVDALALSDIGQIVEFCGEHGIRFKPADQIPEAARRAIASVKVKRYPHRTDPTETYELVEFKLWDKNAALRLALQRRGKLVEKHEHAGPGGGPIPVTEVSLTPKERAARVAALIAEARGRQAAEA